MSFWEGFFDLLDDLFGEIGLLWVGLGTLLLILAGYGVWWEWIR